ncbi:ATP-binding protein [Luteimicrobium sp. NPDC057192]|uniref:ATP-binding protein n=1 Tax=Luteimicrobium sp. NPDC057192 TaxID=3346042 RepID=UPI0036340F51
MASAYVHRLSDVALDSLLTGLPAIAIQGAKGVGKTVTARRRSDRTVRFDVAQERDAFAAGAFDLSPRGTTLLDEWQLYPPCWDQVRRAVDDGAPAGSFILAGSTAPPGARIHSGAGRIVTLRMRPLSIVERGLADPAIGISDLFASDGTTAIQAETDVDLDRYVDEIFTSGFPGVRDLTDEARDAWLDGYLSHTVEKEFVEQGTSVRRPGSLRAWLTAYAAATASTATYSRILDAATAGVSTKPARDTTVVYRDVLTRTFVLDPVEPWIPVYNPLKRLTQAPKHFLADPALAVRLLGLHRDDVRAGRDTGRLDPRSGSMLGPLFEHLVAQSVLAYAATTGSRVGHLRQQDGRHEVDLIVERGRRVVAIEVKLAAAVDDHDVRHLLWLRDQLGDDLADAIVVTTGSHAYRRRDGVAVVPAALLGP